MENSNSSLFKKEDVTIKQIVLTDVEQNWYKLH